MKKIIGVLLAVALVLGLGFGVKNAVDLPTGERQMADPPTGG